MTVRMAIILIMAMPLILSLTGCAEISEWQRLGFDKVSKVTLEDTGISRDILYNPEMMFANEDVLVLHDLHDKEIFSTIDLNSGNLINSFGRIGRGEKEILVGTVGYLSGNDFIAYNLQTQSVVKYNVTEGNSSYKQLSVNLPGLAQVSRLVVTGDSALFLMGCYNNLYKYSLWNRDSEVIDSLIYIAGWDNPELNRSHKFLGEQGNVTISPDGRKIACTTNYSDNIDFINVSNGKLTEIASRRMRDAALEPVEFGNNMSQMVPDAKEPMGFMGLTSNDNMVFALYNPLPMGETGYYGKFILRYNWEGKPIEVWDLSETVYAIAANNDALYACVTDEEGLFSIKKIQL